MYTHFLSFNLFYLDKIDFILGKFEINIYSQFLLTDELYQNLNTDLRTKFLE